MTKRIIKLINNERINYSIRSIKATACDGDATSKDFCSQIDQAHCMTYAYDACTKDFAACTYGADDYCPATGDYQGCTGAGTTDKL